MANPVVDDASKVEPPKPHAPLEQAPLEQAGKADVGGDVGNKLAKESPSYTIPKPGDADNKALTTRLDSVGSTPAIAAEFNGQKGVLLNTDKDGAIFKTADGRDTYSVKKSPENDTVTLTRNGDGQVFPDAKITRGTDPINSRPDTSNALSQTDTTRSKTDAPTTTLSLVEGAAVAPVTRKDNVQGSSDGQGRAEAGQTGQTGQTGLAGQRANGFDAAAQTEQVAATEVKKPIISGVQSSSVAPVEKAPATVLADGAKQKAAEVLSAPVPVTVERVPIPTITAPPEKVPAPAEAKGAAPPPIPQPLAQLEASKSALQKAAEASPPIGERPTPPASLDKGSIDRASGDKTSASPDKAILSPTGSTLNAAVPTLVGGNAPARIEGGSKIEGKDGAPIVAPIEPRPTPADPIVVKGSGVLEPKPMAPIKVETPADPTGVKGSGVLESKPLAPIKVETPADPTGFKGSGALESKPLAPIKVETPVDPTGVKGSGAPDPKPFVPVKVETPAPPEVKGRDGAPLIPVKVETPVDPTGVKGSGILEPKPMAPIKVETPVDSTGVKGSGAPDPKPFVPVKVETPAPPEVKGRDGAPFVPVKVETPLDPIGVKGSGVLESKPLAPIKVETPVDSTGVKGSGAPDPKPFVPVKVETPAPPEVKGKDGSVAFVPPTMEKPANPKPDPGVGGGDLHLDQKPGQIKPPAEPIVSPPADALKRDGTLKTGLDPVEKLPVGKDPVKDPLGKDSGDKTQSLNPNAPTTVSGATNQNGPTLDKAGDPGKLKVLDPGAVIPVKVETPDPAGVKGKDGSVAFVPPTMEKPANPKPDPGVGGGDLHLDQKPGQIKPPAEPIVSPPADALKRDGTLKTGLDPVEKLPVGKDPVKDPLGKDSGDKTQSLNPNAPTTVSGATNQNGPTLDKAGDPGKLKVLDPGAVIPVKVETPDPAGVKGKDGSVAFVPPTMEKPANPKPDPGVGGGDLHLDQKPGQIKPPAEPIVSPPADALKRDGTLKTGLDPVEKLPVGKDPVKDPLGKDSGDKTQSLNPNAPTTVSGATNQNGPTLDKAGDPGKLKVLDPGAVIPVKVETPDPAGVKGKDGSVAFVPPTPEKPGNPKPDPGVGGGDLHLDQKPGQIKPPAEPIVSPPADALKRDGTLKTGLDPIEKLPVGKDPVKDPLGKDSGDKTQSLNPNAPTTVSGATNQNGPTLDKAGDPGKLKVLDPGAVIPVKVETPDPAGVKGKDGSVAFVPPTPEKPGNPKPDPGVGGGDLHLDQKPGQIKPPAEPIVSSPADALKRDGTLKTGLDPIEKLPVGKDPVKDPLGKDSGDKTQSLNPNAPTTVSGATNQNGPTLDKAGDPGKLKVLDPGAVDASQLGPMGAATGARGTGDGSGTLQKVGLDGQPKIGAIDGIKDAKDPKDPKDASLAKLNDGTKALNPLDPQNLAMADWQNMRQQWLQNRGAMQQALLANALNPGGIPGAVDMDQRHAQWLANRQAMLDLAGLSGLNPNAMTREQRMLQMNLNRQSIADGIALGALDPMQMRAMMCQQWQLQRQLLMGQNDLIGSPDYLAMRQQWLQNRLLMQGGLQDGSGALSPQDMMRQMWMLRMADFLRNQTTTDQLAMGVSGRMYQELNRVRDTAGQVEGGGRIPLSELINRRLENQQNGQFVSSLNLTPPSRLDATLPSRADMQNLTNPGLLTSRPGFEALRQGVLPEIKGRLEPGGKTELANKSQKENLQDSVRKAAESVIETAAGAKAAHDAAKKIEHRIDNVILGIRQNEVENLTTQQNAASRRTSEVANVANNSNTDAALLAAITARQLKEEKDLKERLLQAEKNKKKDDGKRRKIVVKEKDTLDTICKRYLRDVRLVPLIYEINAHILQAKARIKKNGEVQLVAGTILWLPSTTEVETFRGRLTAGYMSEVKSNEKALTAEEELTERFGGNWNGAPMDDSTSEANRTRRQNIESLLGPLSKNDDAALYYTCRLGDTLKSIAVKHPALKDPSLWKLIAEINKLTTAIDSKGVPLAQVVRGAKIRLPDADEVAAFLNEKRRASQSKADEFVSATRYSGAATTVADPERPIEHKINSLKDAGALMLQAGGFKPLSEALTDPLTPTGPPTTYLSVTEFQRSQAQLLENSKNIENVRAFSNDCRIVRRHLAHFDGSRSFQAQLDVMVNGDWKVALVYNVSDADSWCQRFGQDGKVEKVKIQLPTSAIHQMLENDVNSNWQQYRDRMIG